MRIFLTSRFGAVFGRIKNEFSSRRARFIRATCRNVVYPPNDNRRLYAKREHRAEAENNLLLYSVLERRCYAAAICKCVVESVENRIPLYVSASSTPRLLINGKRILFRCVRLCVAYLPIGPSSRCNEGTDDHGMTSEYVNR